MNEQIKLEVVLEIIAMKIGIEINCGNEKEVIKLVNIRKDIYNEKIENIDSIIKVYGRDIKQIFKILK